MTEGKIRKPVTGGAAAVPVVMQLEALECGAACLCMVLAYYRKWIPLERVRADCGVSRDGSNARNIVLAARGYGMNAQGIRCEPEDLRREGRFPCILFWEFNHFVVLKGFRGNKALLNDPARGSCAISMERFDEAFTGVCLTFEPGESFRPEGRPKSMLSFAAKRLRGAGTAVAFVAVTATIAAVTDIFRAGFSRVFLDQILPGKNPRWTMPFFIGLAVLTAAELAASWIRAIYSLRLDGKMAAVGSTSFVWKVLRLPMEFFSQRMAGDIQSRQSANASVAHRLVDLVAPLVIQTATLVFYLVAMIRISPLMTIVGMSSLLINVFVSGAVSAKRINITRVLMRDQGKLAGATVGAVDMIETIKASGAERGYFEHWAGYQASVNTQSVRSERTGSLLGAIPEAVTALMNAVVLALGIGMTMRGRFTAGTIYMFQGFLSSFMAPAEQFLSAGRGLQEMRTEMERIEDVMEYPEDPAFSGGEAGEGSEKLTGDLSIRHATFGYSRLAPPLIEDFSLELRRGRSVAFVGASGSGKSTLAKLISGLYRPWSGEILFDGKPIGSIDRSVFTGSVAVVDQDIVLFEDTIANNIKMWDPSIEDFEMILAARDACIHEDIMRREGGYQYRLAEDGRDLSGGQRQRLEIARVLAQDPTMIILDEATSALDARTEHEIVESIRARGITCVVVAHRLSTVRSCDEILVLDHGRVAERGTHAQLMALDGLYRQLVCGE